MFGGKKPERGEIGISKLDKKIFKDALLLLFLPERIKEGNFIFTQVKEVYPVLVRTEYESLRTVFSFENIFRVYDLRKIYFLTGKYGVISFFKTKLGNELKDVDVDPLNKVKLELQEVKNPVLMIEFKNQKEVEIWRSVGHEWTLLHKVA